MQKFPWVFFLVLVCTILCAAVFIASEIAFAGGAP